MKKTCFYIGGIMLIAVWAFSACVSQNEFAGENAEPAKAFTVSIPATYINADTRAVELTANGNYLKAYFKEGDRVRVFKSNSDLYTWNQRDLVTIGSSGTSTILTGTLTNKYAEGDELLLSYENPENLYNSIPIYGYGVQDGTFDSASKWDFAYAKVKVLSVDTEAGILETEAAKFESLQSFFCLSFVDKDKNPVKAKGVRIESGKTLASFIYPRKSGNEYRFDNYRVFLKTPSSDVWVVMTVCEGATGDETVTFIVEGEDGKIYKGTKKASVGGLGGIIKNGKYYASTIELEAAEIVNTLKIESDDYALSDLTYRIKADAIVTGKSYLAYNLSAFNSGITITLDNVDITKEGACFSNYNDNVTINLVGDNHMTNTDGSVSGFNLYPRSGSLTFKGSGTLVINNCYLDPLSYLNITYEDGLIATYDPVTNTTTIAPVSKGAAIVFEDEKVKDVCLLNWDSNADGLISYAEAAAVKDLGTAFKGNTFIRHFMELRFFSGLTSIPQSAFEGCTALETIVLPNSGISSIEARAFKGVTSMTQFPLPYSVTKIGESAFEGCTALTGSSGTYLYFSSVLSVIGDNAFKGCTKLYGLSFHSSNLVIGTSAFEDSSVSDCNFPSNYNSSIQFGDRAFAGSKLESVYLYATTISFGKNVFLNCESLNRLSIYYAVTPPGFGEDMLKGSKLDDSTVSSRVIAVPSASVDAYKVTEGWNNYADIIIGI